MKSSSRGLLLSLVPALLLACADAPEAPAELGETLSDLAGQRGVRVMTQNMYVGLDVLPLAFVTNRPEDRIDAIANQIALTRPHLVGLQEVTRLYEQTPSDTMTGVFTPNATDELIDFLAVLLDELARRGLVYEVAAERLGTDIEVPRFDGMVDGNPTFSDLRATFSDVLLRRAGVQTTPLFALDFDAALPFPPIPGTLVHRSAVGVIARLGGRDVRVVNTHLEVIVDILPDEFQPQFAQVAQLTELLATDFQPELPTIVLGDFNSPAETGRSYQAMVAAGYSDLWTESLTGDLPGFTCCQDAVLTNPESLLFERIDHIWTKDLALEQPILAFTLGDLPFFRTLSQPRLWPSDHAGVVALLRL